MIKKHGGYAVLVELITVLLFFALSSVIILRLFSTAYIIEKKSSASTRILLLAQDWADRISTTPNIPQLLLSSGWTDNNSQLTLKVDDGLLVVTGLKEEAGANGKLLFCELSAYTEAQKIFEFPVARYHIKEAVP